MKTSPFKFGTVVSNKFFTDRENEIKHLKTNFSSGINTIIISPRRWGKSSLVEKVINELKTENKKIIPVLIDLFTVNSEKEFYEKYAKQIIKTTTSGFKEVMKEAKNFFRTVIPKFHYSPVPEQDFSLSLDWNKNDNYTEDILELPERIANKKKISIIICIDEFQNLAQIKGFEVFEKKLRAHWQKFKKISFCLYGSKRHMMKELFNTSSKPFYRFGEILFLEKIQRDNWIDFIINSFKDSGKKISVEAAAEIVDLMHCHPWYVQQLSHYTWERTDRNAGKNEAAEALDLLLRTNSPLYIRDCESLSTTQLNLLKAIVSGEKNLSSTDTMQKYKLGTSGNVVKNKNTLIEKDIIDFTNREYEFIDPAFEIWFRKWMLD